MSNRETSSEEEGVTICQNAVSVTPDRLVLAVCFIEEVVRGVRHKLDIAHFI